MRRCCCGDQRHRRRPGGWSRSCASRSRRACRRFSSRIVCAAASARLPRRRARRPVRRSARSRAAALVRIAPRPSLGIDVYAATSTPTAATRSSRRPRSNCCCCAAKDSTPRRTRLAELLGTHDRSRSAGATSVSTRTTPSAIPLFVDTLRPSNAALDRAYSSRVVSHFYTPEEIEGFREHWAGAANADGASARRSSPWGGSVTSPMQLIVSGCTGPARPASPGSEPRRRPTSDPRASRRIRTPRTRRGSGSAATSVPFVTVCCTAVGSTGGGSPTSIRRRIPEEVARRRSRSSATSCSNLDAHRPWVMKEPRLCLLLPLLRPVLEAPVCIHVTARAASRSPSRSNAATVFLPRSVSPCGRRTRSAPTLAAGTGAQHLRRVQRTDGGPGGHDDGTHRPARRVGVQGLRIPTNARSPRSSASICIVNGGNAAPERLPQRAAARIGGVRGRGAPPRARRRVPDGVSGCATVVMRMYEGHREQESRLEDSAKESAGLTARSRRCSATSRDGSAGSKHANGI